MAMFKNPRRQIVARGGAQVAPRQDFQIMEPKCKVCTHPQRREIDMMLALGWSQADVIRHWNGIMELQGLPKEECFTRSGMSSHVTRHLSLNDKANTRIIEARARAEGIDIDTVEGFILTKQSAAEILVAKGLDSLHRGHTTVEPKDILTAIQTLDKLEKDRASMLEETMLRELRAFTEAVKSVVPEEDWELIYQRFEENVGGFNPAIMPGEDVIQYEEIEDAELDDNQLTLFDPEEYSNGYE